MAIAKVADRATVNSNTAGTTFDFSLASMTVGNLLIIRGAVDNSGGGGAATSLTVTNQTGTPINTSTDVQFTQNNDPGAASAGVTAFVVLAEITAASGTVRITTGASSRLAAVAEEWSGINPIATAVVGTPVGANGVNSTTFASMTDSSVADGNMAYGMVAVEGPSTDTFTQDSDTTNGSWVGLTRAGLTSATATDNVTVAGAYKLVTATGAQTYNTTGGTARDTAGLILEFAAAPVTVGLSVDLQWNVATGAYISAWAHSTDTADGTSHTVNLPAHAVGDRLLAFISYDLDGSAESVQTPTDFTHLTSILPSGSLTRQEVKERRSVTGSESWFGQSSFTFTTSYSTQICVSIACIKNHDPNQAVVSATASLASGNSANVGSVSIPWAGDSLIILSVTNSDKATVTSTPSGYTSNGQIQSSGAGADAASLWTGSKTTTASSEDPAAVGLSAAVAWTGIVLAVREVQTVVGKSVDLLWDVEVVTPVGKTLDVRWDTSRAVGRFAFFRGQQNKAYNWNQVQIPSDNPATSWDGTYQYVSWVNPSRHYMIAQRRHGSDFGSTPVDLFNQTPTALNAVAELDNHNYVSIGVDSDGYIHLAGGMHAGGGGIDEALRYMRSANPNDITSWVVPGGGTGSMVGTSETMVTYPQFLNLADGTLLFFYRSGESGIGDWLINEYDTSTDTWSRVGTIWLSGIADDVSAYPTLNIDRRQGTLGRIHSFWTWREDQGGAESNRYICYGYSDDGGATWKKSDDTSYTLPITEATSEVVADPTLTATGKILNNPSTGFDQSGEPLSVTLIETATPNLREYHHFYLSGGVWQDYNTGITGGGRPPIVKFDSGTVWALVRTTDASLKGGVAAIDLTTPGSHTTKVLWSGDSLQGEWHVDTRALDLRDEIHVIAGPTRATGVQTGDSGELAQYPATAVFIVDENDPIVYPIIHRRGPVTFQEKTTASTWQVTPGFAAAAGETVVVAFAHNPQTFTSVTDSKSNTWQAAATSTNASGSDLRIWYSRLATALTSTDTVTLTWSGSTTDRSAIFDVLANVATSSPVVSTDNDTGSSTTPISQIAAAAAEGNVVYAAVAVEGPSGDTFTAAADADTPWSVVSRVGTTGSTDDTNTTVARQWAIIDGTPVTRTFAPTLGTSRDWASAVVEFKPEPSGTDATATPATIATVTALPAVTTSAGASTTVTTIVTATSMPAVTPSAGSSITLTAIVTVSTLPVVTVTSPVSTTLTTIATSSTLPATGQAAGGGTTPATITTASTLPAVGPQASSTVTLTTIVTASAMPAVNATSGVTAALTAIATSSTLPAVTKSIGAGPTPATIATAATLPVVGLQASSTVVLAAIATTTTLPATTAGTGTSKTLTAIATTTTLPAVTASGGFSATATPATITTSSTLPAVTVSFGSSVQPATIATVTTLPAVVATGLLPIIAVVGAVIRSVTTRRATTAVTARRSAATVTARRPVVTINE